MKFKVLAALAALSVAQPASAAIITVTASGTLSNGFDQSGLFGAANTDLTGAIFSLVMTYDTTQGGLHLGGPTEYLAGGIHWDGTLLSPGSSVITVNGVPVFQSGNVSSLFLASQNTIWAETIERSWADHVTVENAIDLQAQNLSKIKLLDGWHSDCPAEDQCRGGFVFSNYHYDTNPGQPQYYLFSDVGTFDVDTFDVSVTGAVPEPATWAMMIAGFGLVGATLRRRAAGAA